MCIIEGDLNKSFVFDYTIQVDLSVITIAISDENLSVELRAFGAQYPLSVATLNEAGIWSLNYVIPPEYSGRYFSIHVQNIDDTAQ